MYTGFWYGNLGKRDHLEETGVDGGIILKWNVRKWDVAAWTGFWRVRRPDFKTVGT
jgi:hypothetical protein